MSKLIKVSTLILSSSFDCGSANKAVHIFILGLTRMKGLRDEAQKWKISCSYEQLGMDKNNKLRVAVHELDPLDSGTKCPKVMKIRINGQGCDDCVIGMTRVLYPYYVHIIKQLLNEVE